MDKYINADKVLADNAELADCDFNHPKYEDTLRDIIDRAQTEDVIPLDLVKQAREEMEGQKCKEESASLVWLNLGINTCIGILDKLITVAERRPAWITDEKIQWSNAGNIYTGYAADLTKLPIGTEFIVQNGGWLGRIVERNGEKLVQIGSDTRLMHPNALVVAIENVKIPAKSDPDLQEEQEEER